MRLIISSIITSCLTLACGGSKKSSDAQTVTINETEVVKSTNGAFYARMAWQTPIRSGRGNFNTTTVILLNRNEAAAADASVDVFHPWMITMGHGTSEASQVIEATNEPGSFLVSGIYFNMGGDAGEWVIELTATVDGEQDTASVPLPKVD